MSNCKLKIKSENKGANLGSNRINNLIQNNKIEYDTINYRIGLSNQIYT